MFNTCYHGVSLHGMIKTMPASFFQGSHYHVKTTPSHTSFDYED